MKQKNCIAALLIILITASSCKEKKAVNHEQANEPIVAGNTTAASQPAAPELVTGDFYGDGNKEQAWVITPAFNKDSSDCKEECITIIRFSDTLIPSIQIKNAVSAEICNLGKIQTTDTDLLGVLPGSFAGCWNDYHVYRFANKQWKEAVKPFPVHCNQWDEGMPPVKADSLHKGNVIISYSTQTGKGIETKTKSVPVQ